MISQLVVTRHGEKDRMSDVKGTRQQDWECLEVKGEECVRVEDRLDEPRWATIEDGGPARTLLPSPAGPSTRDASEVTRAATVRMTSHCGKEIADTHVEMPTSQLAPQVGWEGELQEEGTKGKRCSPIKFFTKVQVEEDFAPRSS